MERILTHAQLHLRRPVLVLAFTGWSDAGQVATNALKFMAQQLDAKPVASVDPEDFFDFTVNRPNVQRIDGVQRVITWNTLDFMAAEIGSSEHDYLFAVGPEPHLRWKTFCATVLGLAHEYQVQRVVLLGGFLAEILYTKPVPVSGVGSDAELLRRLDVTLTQYEGPTGIVGVLSSACAEVQMPFLSLWAAVPHYTAAVTNPRGSLALLLRFMQAVPTPLDLSPLHTAAAAFEEQIEQAIDKDPKLAAYVRDLKKRDSAH